MSGFGNYKGIDNYPSSSNSTGVYDLFEVHAARESSKWPNAVTVTYTSAVPGLNANLYYNLVVYHQSKHDGGNISWVIENVSGGASPSDLFLTTSGILSIGANASSTNLALRTKWSWAMVNSGNITFDIVFRNSSNTVVYTASGGYILSLETPIVRLSPTTSANEGSSVMFYIDYGTNISTSNTASVSVGYSVSGTVNTSDYTATVQSFYNYPLSSRAVVNYAMTNDYTAEGSETLTVSATLDGVSIGSDSVTINDTSNVPPAGDTTFTEISSRFIANSVTSDYTGNYDVTQYNVSNTLNGSVILCTKITSGTTYYSDICVAGILHYSSSNVLKNSWIPYNSSGGTMSGWVTTTSGTSGTAGGGVPITPIGALGLPYSSVSAGSTVNKWNWATSTGSSYTGCAGGIDANYNSPSTGNDLVPQVGANYFAYVEASGSTLNQCHFLKSPSVSFAAGDKLLIVHLAVGYSASAMNPDDCLFIAVAG